MIGVAFVCSPVRSVPVAILTYHDVIERRDAKSLWFDCTAGELEAQIKWLSVRGARFVSLDQVRDHLSGVNPLPSKSVAITFADNYEGFYKRAWPILKRIGVPVAMFVHTGFVGDRHGRPKMTWAQLEELDRSGLVTVASQTVSHPSDLTRMTDLAIEREFTQSRASLQTRLKHPIAYLAYPNGKCDTRVAAIAERVGYTLAFSEALRPATPGDYRWLIGRYVHTKYRQAWQDSFGRLAPRDR